MSETSLRGDHGPAGALPRLPLIGMAALAVAAIGLAGFSRMTGIGTVAAPESPVVATVSLTFSDRDDGAALVRDEAGRLVDTLPVGAEGFVRGAMRSLMRERKMRALGPEHPVRVERHANGRLSLTDPQTGARIALDAFGPSNSAAFARYLTDTQGGRP